MSKRKAAEPVALPGKAAGKRRMDSAQELDDTLDQLLGGDLAEDSTLNEAVLDNAEQLVEDLADEEEADCDGDDEEGPAAAMEPELMEVGELPDGLSEAQLLEGDDVDLSGHSLTLPQARRVAQSLAQNTSLSTVRFGNHSLPVGDLREDEELEWDSEEYSDIDAIIIAELLKSNTEVKRLDLARNQIGDAGAYALAAMLGTNTTIEYLNLESNTFGERGGNAFCDVLGANSSVQYLNLMYNSVPSSVQEALRKMWQDSQRGQGVGLHL